MSVANDSATVDLPSLGSDDVMPIVLLSRTMLLSAVTLTALIDSLKRENGALATIQDTLLSRVRVRRRRLRRGRFDGVTSNCPPLSFNLSGIVIISRRA